jgi:signal transduction histidine kinase
VFSNLLGNAVRHSPAGSIVRIHVDGRKRESVEVGIHNPGLIPAEVLPSIFEPFTQGPSRRTGRLGLGLFIAREIVHAHGGTIEAVSEEPTGTSFRVVLPRGSPES